MMKKLVTIFFILIGILGFSQDEQRNVERCKVTSIGKYKDGRVYMNCISLQSGKNFNFIGQSNTWWYESSSLEKDKVYSLWFYGKGYKNLSLHDMREVYSPKQADKNQSKSSKAKLCKGLFPSGEYTGKFEVRANELSYYTEILEIKNNKITIYPTFNGQSLGMDFDIKVDNVKVECK